MRVYKHKLAQKKNPIWARKIDSSYRFQKLQTLELSDIFYKTAIVLCYKK